MRISLKTYFCLLFLCCTYWAFPQIDSIPLVALELSEEDLAIKTSNFNQQKVVSGSRSLQNVDDLPLTVYVITKEEIQRYGYVTLVDALKFLPGIRVSQPGNAVEGETFQMRGLRGNSYAKILINNIPVKPVVTGGMPIGAQLPIQQADRIEVIYGPAAAVYGADASAGVINIILEKKERPTFTQARLNAGAIGGYSDLNVLFGGKLGRNKSVINFSIYGSSTILNDRQTVYDDDLYNPINYARSIPFGGIDTSYVTLGNYRGDSATSARFSSLPHLSRMFGMDLYFRNWRFNFSRMYRRDHSAIGLNPMVISYGNPLNYFGEDITNVSLNFSKRKKKWGAELNFFYLGYLVDNRSSYQLINQSLFQGMDFLARTAAINPVDSSFNFMLYDTLRTEIYDKYFSGSRFSYAESDELGVEQIYSYAVKPWLELTVGINARGVIGIPLSYLSRIPVNPSQPTVERDSPLPLIDYLGGRFSTFMQAFVAREKWNMTLGLQYYLFGAALDNITLPRLSGFNPRLAFLYKFNPKLSLRTFYGTAFRAPSPYYYVNTFSIEQDLNQPLKIAGLPLDAESTTAFELGLRWSPISKMRIDALAFYNYTNNFVSFNFNNQIQSLQDINSRVGYFNNTNDAISVSGAQTTIDYKNIVSLINLDARLNIQYANSFEVTNQNNSFAAREVPSWSASAIISVRPLPKLSLSFLNLYQGTSTINRQEDLELGFYVMDGVVRYDLSNKFQALLRINNVFNKRYAGLLATRTPDDLYYNPQSLRIWQVGLSYRTN